MHVIEYTCNIVAMAIGDSGLIGIADRLLSELKY
jgi:hypothetical protein